MRVFINKRTHPGDPRAEGIFGIEDCIGTKRNCNFDAVIGIGGKTCTKARFKGICFKVNWVGVTPKRVKINVKDYRADALTFEKFSLYEEQGAIIEKEFPALFKYMYSIHERTRSLIVDTEDIKTYGVSLINEIQKILSNTGNSASPAYYVDDECINDTCRTIAISRGCKTC